MNFSTIVDDKNYLDVQEASGEFTGGKLTVDWAADMESRSWGIKSIYAYATSVKGYLWMIENDQEKRIDIETGANGWQLESEMKFDDDSVSVGTVLVDFKDKTITVFSN